MQLRGSGSVRYQPHLPRSGWAEQDPTLWLEALAPAIAGALQTAGYGPADIGALCVCGQLDGCIATASDGSALAPAIIWMDRRGSALLETMVPAQVRERCGLVLVATHMGGKIAWLDRNLPERRQVACWHQPVSFVVAALVGERVMSRSLASTTMLYDLAAGAWAADLAASFGASLDELPRLGGEAEIAGRLTTAGAGLTGLPVGVPVAVGTGDDFSNLIGCSICAPGVAGVSLGTSEAVGALAPQPIVDSDMLVETHVYPGALFHLGNPGWLSGGAVRWAAALLGVAGDDAFMALAAKAPAGCDGVTFLPALSGAMAPKWIAAARGSFAGLRLGHGPDHMARAVLEGCAFAMRDVVDRLDALGVATPRLRIVGGGAPSRRWAQMHAQVAQRPAEVLTASDASATGAAVLAAVAGGTLPDIATAAAALHLPLVALDPDTAARDAYDNAYRRYRGMFSAMEPLWRSSTAIVRRSWAAR
jgi:xylulokinase